VEEFCRSETLFYIFLTIESVRLTLSLIFFYIFLQKASLLKAILPFLPYRKPKSHHGSMGDPLRSHHDPLGNHCPKRQALLF